MKCLIGLPLLPFQIENLFNNVNRSIFPKNNPSAADLDMVCRRTILDCFHSISCATLVPNVGESRFAAMQAHNIVEYAVRQTRAPLPIDARLQISVLSKVVDDVLDRIFGFLGTHISVTPDLFPDGFYPPIKIVLAVHKFNPFSFDVFINLARNLADIDRDSSFDFLSYITTKTDSNKYLLSVTSLVVAMVCLTDNARESRESVRILLQTILPLLKTRGLLKGRVLFWINISLIYTLIVPFWHYEASNAREVKEFSTISPSNATALEELQSRHRVMRYSRRPMYYTAILLNMANLAPSAQCTMLGDCLHLDTLPSPPVPIEPEFQSIIRLLKVAYTKVCEHVRGDALETLTNPEHFRNPPNEYNVTQEVLDPVFKLPAFYSKLGGRELDEVAYELGQPKFY